MKQKHLSLTGLFLSFWVMNNQASAQIKLSQSNIVTALSTENTSYLAFYAADGNSSTLNVKGLPSGTYVLHILSVNRVNKFSRFIK